jgi:predicted TIM-barrel fold metal-dependent hydrolase
VDLSAMPSELGRAPFTAHDFLIKYSDRILFGTDGNPNQEVYQEYFRFMETADEYFDYPKYRRYNAGRWEIYGLHLPDDVLRKIYHDNAARILGLPLLEETTSR